MPVSRSDARRLATEAMNMGASVWRGTVALNDTEIVVGDKSIREWLARLEGQEVVLVVGRVALLSEEPEPVTCRTCGTDYIGVECPRCADVRSRLRGR
jgi:hypothetical protein